MTSLAANSLAAAPRRPRPGRVRDAVTSVVFIAAGAVGAWYSFCLWRDTFDATYNAFAKRGPLPRIALPENFNREDLWNLLVALDLSAFHALTVLMFCALLTWGYFRVLCGAFGIAHVRLATWPVRLVAAALKRVLTVISVPVRWGLGPLYRGGAHAAAPILRRLKPLLNDVLAEAAPPGEEIAISRRPRAVPRDEPIFPKKFAAICLLNGFLGTIFSFVLAAIASDRMVEGDYAPSTPAVAALTSPEGAIDSADQTAGEAGEPERFSRYIFVLIVASLVSTGVGIIVGPFGVPLFEGLDRVVRGVRKREAGQPEGRVEAAAASVDVSPIVTSLNEATRAATALAGSMNELMAAAEQRWRDAHAETERLAASVASMERGLSAAARAIVTIPERLAGQQAQLVRTANLLADEIKEMRSVRYKLVKMYKSFRRVLGVISRALSVGRSAMSTVVQEVGAVTSAQVEVSAGVAKVQADQQSLSGQFATVASRTDLIASDKKLSAEFSQLKQSVDGLCKRFDKLDGATKPRFAPDGAHAANNHHSESRILALLRRFWP